ncbi:kelch domain-containing protein 10-like [Gastrophryne carolinensis]
MPGGMIGESAAGAWEPLCRRERLPCDRYKHASALHGGFVYVHGGRQDSVLGDFWRYDIALKQWEQLPGGRQAPDRLEGHSMVAYQGALYVFGGMMDFGATREKSPLWMYAIDARRWSEYKSPAAPEATPTNRKGHSAVVYQSAMFIYGGYFDIAGAAEEFWAFYFDSNKWSALSPRTRGLGPGPRHGHSCAAHNAAMYLFGGLKNMTEQNDFWRFDFRRHNWANIKASSGPPQLVGHASVVQGGGLWIIGGGLPSRSSTSNLWKYEFSSRSWKKLSRGKERADCAKMYHCAVPLDARPDPGCPEEPDQLYSRHSWGSGKVAAMSTSELIEMKSFKEPPSPVFCSCSSPSDQTEELLLTSYENQSFTYSGDEADDWPARRAGPETRNVLLVIGGKPLSRHGDLTLAHIALE